MPEPAATSRSLRTAVIGLVSDFANEQDITCGLTHQAMAEMVFSLAAYREEESPLFPEVYVILNPDTIKLLSAVPQSLELGSGPPHPVTVSMALKTCAPLACDGWAMFLRRDEGGFSFGVFRSRESVLALSASEQMLSSVDVGAPAVLLRHSKSNCVELVGRRGDRLEVRLTSEQDGPTLGKPPWFSLAERLSQDVTDPNLKEIVKREFIANISAACRGSHGTMIAVIAATETEVPAAFRDGVLLSEPIDVVGLIERTHSSKDMASMNELISAQALIRGMIRSDGITLMDLNGKTLGFRVFVKAKPEEHVAAVTGGARSRAFELLRLRVGHELDSAMFWSQDGRSDFVGGAV